MRLIKLLGALLATLVAGAVLLVRRGQDDAATTERRAPGGTQPPVGRPSGSGTASLHRSPPSLEDRPSDPEQAGLNDPDALADTEAGRDADTPREIPREGWKAVALRVKAEVKNDNVALLAAGVAFYAMLSLFPALLAAVSIYGLVADPQTVQNQIQALTSALPDDAAGLIGQQLRDITSAAGGGLGVGAVIGIASALWTASGGTKGLMAATNVAYEEVETRKFLKLRAIALALTLGAILFGLLAIGLIAVVPVVMDAIGLGTVGRVLTQLLRWPLLAALVIGGLAVLYRFGPDRDNPRWAWVSWGSVIATVLWLVASVGFSLYVSNFGQFNETYGSLGAVIVLLLWFFLTAFIVLLGAEINAETERQTARDTTQGPERPMGSRDAVMADTTPADAR